jgi:hypothetical protein
VKPAALLVIAAVSLAPRVLAQGLEGGALGYNVKYRILYRGYVAEQSGFFFGAHGAASLGPLRVGLSGIMGTLAAADSANPGRQVRSTSLTAHVRATPRLAAGVEIEARRFESEGVVTLWRLIGANARGALSLGLSGLSGTAEASFFPLAQVNPGAAALKVALRGVVGVSYSPLRSPMSLHLGYRFERFDFESDGQGPQRAEQFEGLVLGVGARLGR